MGARIIGHEHVSPALDLVSPNRKIFEARKRETAALGAGEKLVLGHPLADGVCRTWCYSRGQRPQTR